MFKTAWIWLGVCSWLFIGLLIVGISFYKVNQIQLLPQIGRAEEGNIHMVTKLGDMQLLATLPEVEVHPGSWKYPFKAAYDWMWWRSSRSDEEQTRRLLWLANQRVRSGYELVLSGEPVAGVEQLIKAESYLQKSASQAATVTEMHASVEASAERHVLVLERAEELVPEQLRPRVTEIKNVPVRLK